MGIFIKTYRIREKAMFSDGAACSVNLPFSNCENHKRARIIYNSVLYSVPTTEMFTPEASRNRKYQIKQ